jgi:hypothetical protein
MLAPRTRESSKDHHNHSLGFLKSVVPLVTFFSFLVFYFPIALVIFSYVSFNENMTISSCVVAARMPYARHIFEIFKLPVFEELLSFVCHGHGVGWPTLLIPSIVLIALLVGIILVVLIWEPFPRFFLCCNRLLNCTLEFFVVSRVLLAEITELPLG